MVRQDLSEPNLSAIRTVGCLAVRQQDAAFPSCADFAIQQEKLASLAKSLTESHKVKVIYRAVDVGDDKAVDEAVTSVVAEFGDIDILINNVGPLCSTF